MNDQLIKLHDELIDYRRNLYNRRDRCEPNSRTWYEYTGKLKACQYIHKLLYNLRS